MGADGYASDASDIAALVASTFNAANSQAGQAALMEWQALSGSLQNGMDLEEVFSYLSSDTEAGQAKILNAVASRLGRVTAPADSVVDTTTPTDRVRILTMHGSKGLAGRVVFIPGLEQGITPSSRALRAAGLVQEQRRLLYMSLTRARVACVLSLCNIRVGQQAFALVGNPSTNQAPSMFLNDIGIPPQARVSGLSTQEIASILSDDANM